MTEQSPWLTTDQAAIELNEPESTIRRMCAVGDIPRRRITDKNGRTVRYLIHVDVIRKRCEQQLSA